MPPKATTEHEEEELASPEELEALHATANQLLERLVLLEQARGKNCGIHKFRRKVLAEKEFLESMRSGSIPPKKSRVAGSNLSNLLAVVDVAEKQPDVVAIDKRFAYTDRDEKKFVTVDVVANNGALWIKVTARNVRGLHTVWSGEGGYGKKSIVDISGQIAKAARENPINFERPALHFVFAGGLTPAIHVALSGLGATVEGEVVALEGPPVAEHADDASEDSSSDEEALAAESPDGSDGDELIGLNRDMVNLDVSTLIALVSELTNGDPRSFQSKDKVLQAMALDEVGERMLPRLQSFLADKKLVACATAVKHFRSICEAIAGPNELRRAAELLAVVEEVPDNMSARTLTLQESARVKIRSKVIFGTGDSLKVLTTTANASFVRAASDQAVKYAAHIHPARALMETQAQRKAQRALPADTSVTHVHASAASEVSQHALRERKGVESGRADGLDA